MPAHDPEFDQIINQGFSMNPTESTDPNPYGAPVQAQKAGLTKRGKAALGIGAAVLAGGGLIGYQVHSSNVAEAEMKAQEIALKADALELEKLKELNRAAEAQRTVSAGQEKARQASVDACIKQDKALVGKGFGSPTYRQVIDDCQARYGQGTSIDGMQPAGSATTTNSTTASGSSEGVNGGVLVGVGALALLVLGATRKGRSTPA